jgi:uncharacterized protein
VTPGADGVSAGSAARIVFGKWGGGPHWEYDVVRLGVDAHGTWLGAPTGTPMVRPGLALHTSADHVVLVPDHGFVASFYAYDSTRSPRIYVDISTPPRWDGHVMRAVDLDLDVVLDRAGRVLVDDEDEFAEHRVRFGYPDDVVALAMRTCDEVRHAIEAREPPFDGATAARWLDLLARLLAEQRNSPYDETS